jgi:ABC-type metal ion transport system substrate-binding protein
MYFFEKFVNGELTKAQYKNRLFCKSKNLNYTLLEDLKEKHGIILPNDSYFNIEPEKKEKGIDMNSTQFSSYTVKWI